VHSDVSNLPHVTEFVNAMLETIATRHEILKIDMVIDEIFTNIDSYGYVNEKGDITVQVDIPEDKSRVTLTFIDTGIPYNPLLQEDPDLDRNKLKKQEGGLGIYMVKNTMDEMKYEYKDKQNILTLTKRIGGHND
jgi:sigma-B regulation protein RsbU (phosphoserine phosphatase)